MISLSNTKSQNHLQEYFLTKRNFYCTRTECRCKEKTSMYSQHIWQTYMTNGRKGSFIYEIEQTFYFHFFHRFKVYSELCVLFCVCTLNGAPPFCMSACNIKNKSVKSRH